MVPLVVIALMSAPSWQAPSQPSSGELDRDFVRQTVESLAEVVHREYMDADLAAHVDKSLRKWLAEGRYASPQTPEWLATTLTRDLFATTRDKHLAVDVIPERESGPARDQGASDQSREAAGRRSNFGVQRAEILSGNVGYLNITAFYRRDEAGDAISAAMKLLRHADAVILDLRANGGGSPDTVALVASYLLETPGLELFEIVPRSGEGGGRYRTETAALPERNGRRPVYALTAKGTFSAGEGLAFLLQERRRAEVIGETTAGAANPGRPYPLNARFNVTVPNGRVRSAVSGRNWEGVGVVPDVGVPAPEALRVAHVRALRALLNLTPSGSWYERLEREIRALEEQPPRR